MRRHHAERGSLESFEITGDDYDENDKAARGQLARNIARFTLLFVGSVTLGLWCLGIAFPKAPAGDLPSAAISQEATDRVAATDGALAKMPKKEPGEREELNSILDELMSAHRKDVARREDTIAPPVDMPIWDSDRALLATMADGGYGACALKLVESIRSAGRWGGAIVLLVPTGEGSLPLEDATVARLAELRVSLRPVGPEQAGGSDVRGAGSAAQYGKVSLLVDEDFRKYDTILFLDADGVVGAPLQPLLEVNLPTDRVMAMPTWPSATVKHASLYTREINFGAIGDDAAQRLRDTCPDRTLVGLTAWFLLKPSRLPPPAVMRREVTVALESWRPAFRFNDQGLWNVLFYNTSAFYPLCISGPETVGGYFEPLLIDSLDTLASVIELSCGPGHARRRGIFQHPVKDCIPDEVFRKHVQSNKALPEQQRRDLLQVQDKQRAKQQQPLPVTQ